MNRSKGNGTKSRKGKKRYSVSGTSSKTTTPEKRYKRKIGSMRNRVKVVSRFRPQIDREIDEGGKLCVTFGKNKRTVVVDDGRGKETPFSFDRVFPCDATQKELFEYIGRPAVKDILNGFNATIFAYGQTSAGKTYTMMNIPKNKHQKKKDTKDKRGIGPRIISHLFEIIDELKTDTITYSLKLSFYEIYMERIIDLLSPTSQNKKHNVSQGTTQTMGVPTVNNHNSDELQVKEDMTNGGFYVHGLTEVFCDDAKDVMKYIHTGNQNKKTSATTMNKDSSRSHTILSLTLTKYNMTNATNTISKLNVVDLAGSEKVTHAFGTQLKEAKAINQSLATLGKVIFYLTQKKKVAHIPYRESKLTKLLQESLGGNARTTLLINCSPSSLNCEEIFSTLRFGTSAKFIKVKPIMRVQTDVESLKRALKASELQLLSLKEKNRILLEDYNDRMEQRLSPIASTEIQTGKIKKLVHLNHVLLKELQHRDAIIRDLEEDLGDCNADLDAAYIRESNQRALNLKTISSIKQERDHYKESYEQAQLFFSNGKFSVEQNKTLQILKTTRKLKQEHTQLINQMKSMKQEMNQYFEQLQLREPPKKQDDSEIRGELFKIMEDHRETLPHDVVRKLSQLVYGHPKTVTSLNSTTDSISSVNTIEDDLESSRVLRCGHSELRVCECEEGDFEWKYRWLVLTSKGQLEVYKSIKALASQSMSIAKVGAIDDKLLSLDDDCVFRFNSISERDAWLEDIKKCIL